MEYRYTKSTDIKQIAKIHKEQFPDHYLGNFSENLLEDFYLHLLNSDCIFFVAHDNDQIMGFILGGVWKEISKTLNQFMKRNIIKCFFESLIRPRTWRKSIGKFVSLFIAPKYDPQKLDYIIDYTLLSIATKKGAQGKGIGSGLIKIFDKELSGITDKYYLSVQDTNDVAIHFYKKNGFVNAYSFPGEIQMIKKLL